MSYLKISNLYSNQDILAFRECYAMEKIHGTSAHVAWKDGQIFFFSGGENHARFVALFDEPKLVESFQSLGCSEMIVFGEAYGGKQQGMKHTYGPTLRFVVFDVRIGQDWLDVPDAEQVAKTLGLEFVWYKKIPTSLEELDRERDAPSVQAFRNGIMGSKPREGIVLRPLFEVRRNNGDRIIAKHKGEEFRETASVRRVTPDKVQAMTDAKAIAAEWVTEMRLGHVLDKMPGAGIEQTREVITAMTEDVQREAGEEVIWSTEVKRAIGARAAGMFKRRLQERLKE